MNVDEGRQLGRADAEPLIQLAQEVPLAGTGDPEKLRIPPPWEYRDSPELPARRVASEWDDLPAGSDPFYSRFMGAETSPHVLSRLPGHAGEVYAIPGEVGEGAWVAYIEGMFDRLKESNVLLTMTVFLAHGPQPDFNGEFIYYFSAYVTDLSRYEARTAPGHSIQGEWLWDERAIQRAYLPRNLSWWEKRKRRKAELL
jgi:hypothetical protein